MNKQEILKLIQEKLVLKIKTLENLIEETRASNNETKSSMGDKYETTREMLQQEINNLQIQLNENIRAKNSLRFLNNKAHQTISLGSLIKTDKGLFYIAISLGEIIFKDNKIFVISTESPLGKALNGKTTGDAILLNNTTQIIENIW